MKHSELKFVQLANALDVGGFSGGYHGVDLLGGVAEAGEHLAGLLTHKGGALVGRQLGVGEDDRSAKDVYKRQWTYSSRALPIVTRNER